MLGNEINACKNCGDHVEKNFCPGCGQKFEKEDLTSKHLFRDYLDEVFGINSDIFRTLRLLFTKPGKLSLEFIAGKRMRYMAPFKLYLLLMLIYFFTSSFTESFIPEITKVVKKVNSENFIPEENSEWNEKEKSFLDIEDENFRFDKNLLYFKIKKDLEIPVNKKEMKDLLKNSMQSVIIFILPFTALIYKVFFRKVKYLNHLVLAIHNSCFIFCIWIFSKLFGNYNSIIPLFLFAWIFLYIVFSFKRFTRESWIKIIFKTGGIIVSQVVVMAVVYTLVGIGIFLWLLLIA